MNGVKKFYLVYSNGTDYITIQEFEWGEKRAVPNNCKEIQDWIAEGNTPDNVPGNAFVTITNGVVSFDSVGSAAAAMTAAQDAVKAQQAALLTMGKCTAVINIFLAEDWAQNKGLITAGSRIVPQATAVACYTYNKAIAQILITYSDPNSVSWPIPPTLPF